MLRCRHRPVHNILEHDHRAIKRHVNAKQGSAISMELEPHAQANPKLANADAGGVTVRLNARDLTNRGRRRDVSMDGLPRFG
jgi:hypothetical protein